MNAVGEQGHRAKVTFIDDNGEETDITKALVGVDVSIRSGDVNRVTCHALMDFGSFEGELHDVVLNIIPPDRIPQVIEQLKEKAFGTPRK